MRSLVDCDAWYAEVIFRMRLGRAATYAVFAVVHIAQHPEEVPIRGKEIARSCRLPAGRLLKVLQLLVKARILSSDRGPSGGFRLRKPPAEISVLDIVEAIDGEIDGEVKGGVGLEAMARARAQVVTAYADVAQFARARLRAIAVDALMDRAPAVRAAGSD